MCAGDVIDISEWRDDGMQVHLVMTLIIKLNSCRSHLYFLPRTLWLNGSVALIPELCRPPVTAQYPLLPSLCPENIHFHKSFVKERGDRRCQRAHRREQCWLAHQQQPLKARPRWNPHTQRRHEFASGSRSWHDFFKVHHTSVKNVWRRKKRAKHWQKDYWGFSVCAGGFWFQKRKSDFAASH